MTRTTDTLIALGDRGGFCTAACDLFVSLHVNSLARRRGYTEVRGFETYFLAEARTEDAARVAKMENEAVRFETGESQGAMTGGLDFILKDLQLNEHLRESARAAELVQKKLRTVHTGQDRGVKQAGFMVLTTARRPAILVEMGYSTNPQDGRYLTSRRSQRTMASAIADAIVDYLKDYERKTGGAEVGRRPVSKRRALSLVLVAALLGGCVYYNGMYNTKRLAGSARKAERDGRAFEANNLWGQVITRAESLVARHPDSKYVDEALVLKGVALARLRHARRRGPARPGLAAAGRRRGGRGGRRSPWVAASSSWASPGRPNACSPGSPRARIQCAVAKPGCCAPGRCG